MTEVQVEAPVQFAPAAMLKPQLKKSINSSQHSKQDAEEFRDGRRVPLWQEVLEILRELIRTPSVNPSLAPEEAYGEEAIAKVAEQWLAASGVKSWLEEAAPRRPNVVAEVGTGDGPTLVF